MTKRAAKSGLLAWLTETTQPIFLVDSKRRIRFFNRGAETLLGFEAGDVLGKRTPFSAGLTSSNSFSSREAELEHLLSCLAPPPECFSLATTARMPLNGLENRTSQTLEFIPLVDIAGQVETVLCLISELSPPPLSSADSRYWHQLLSQYLAQGCNWTSSVVLVGQSPLWKKVRRQAEMASRSNCPLLITGPVGSGKTSLARSIIEASHDPDSSNTISIDCKDLSHDSLTTRIRDLVDLQKQGELKDTEILLDDIEHLPRDAQLLLSELATQGVWLLATSRSPLEELRLNNRLAPEFDLLISSLVIEVPTLSDRGPEDLALLMQRFIAEQNISSEHQISGWTEDFLLEAIQYQWPANVAELRDVIMQAHQQAKETRLSAADLPFRFRMGKDAQELRVEQSQEETPFEPLDLEKHLEAIERRLIEKAIEAAAGNKSLAAQSLGMTRAKFYRRLEQLEI